MALLARLTTFVPATTILSSEVNGEFNQLVNLLNGTSTSVHGLLKMNDASTPPLILDQLGSGPIQRWRLTGAEKALINSTGQFESVLTTGTAPMVVASTTEVANFNASRVGGILGSNVAKLDTHKIAWSVSWFYPILPAAVETTESVPRFIVPPAVEPTAILIFAGWVGGSDSGASNIFTLKRRNSAGTLQADLGTIDINGAAQNGLTQTDISDVPLSASDQIYPLFTTRNTASETLVGITLLGTQKLTT